MHSQACRRSLYLEKRIYAHKHIYVCTCTRMCTYGPAHMAHTACPNARCGTDRRMHRHTDRWADRWLDPDARCVYYLLSFGIAVGATFRSASPMYGRIYMRVRARTRARACIACVPRPDLTRPDIIRQKKCNDTTQHNTTQWSYSLGFRVQGILSQTGARLGSS